jgi:hypothetical protein
MKTLMFSCLTPSPLEDCFANLPVDKFNENDTQTIAPLQALGSEVSHVLEMLSDNKEISFTRQSCVYVKHHSPHYTVLPLGYVSNNG